MSRIRRLRHTPGRELAVGIRPEHLTVAEAATTGQALRGNVTLVEDLGSGQLLHVDIQAKPVLTDEVLEIAGDTDQALVQDLEHEAELQRVPMIARVQPGTRYKSATTSARRLTRTPPLLRPRHRRRAALAGA